MKVDVFHHIPQKFEVIHRISQPVHFNWKVGRPELKERRKQIMLELSCTNEEKIKVTTNPVTAAGKPVLLDGPIQVSVQSGDGTVELLDGNSFYVKSGDNPGDSTFLVSGDADLGAGIENISDIVLLHVAGAKASNLGMTAGTPELK
jgi:hypothetical protein